MCRYFIVPSSTLKRGLGCGMTSGTEFKPRVQEQEHGHDLAIRSENEGDTTLGHRRVAEAQQEPVKKLNGVCPTLTGGGMRCTLVNKFL